MLVQRQHGGLQNRRRGFESFASCNGRHRSGGTVKPIIMKDMQILSYCVLIGTLLFLCLNGGEDAGTTTWALSLCGILTALVLMVKDDKTSRHAAPQGDEQTR